MAMSGSEGGEGVLAEINVTPMVDVLLSLLIIFMVAQPAPPNEQLPLNVPQEVLELSTSDPNAPLRVTVNADGTARLGQTPLSANFDEMVEQFRQNEKVQTDNRVVIRGDDTTRYGKIVEIMSAAHQSGVDQVGIDSDRF